MRTSKDALPQRPLPKPVPGSGPVMGRPSAGCQQLGGPQSTEQRAWCGPRPTHGPPEPCHRHPPDPGFVLNDLLRACSFQTPSAWTSPAGSGAQSWSCGSAMGRRTSASACLLTAARSSMHPLCTPRLPRARAHRVCCSRTFRNASNGSGIRNSIQGPLHSSFIWS